MRHRRRRHHRRNPSFGLGFLVSALKDGATISVARVANRKIAGLINQYVPGLSATSPIGTIGAKVLAAAVVGLASRRLLPAYSRLVTAAAMSDAIDAGIAATPLAGYLSAYPRIVRPMVAGYPRAAGALPAGRPAVGAWPTMTGRRSVGMPKQAG